MATRGSAVSRVVRYFREVDLDEGRVAFMLCQEVIEERLKRFAEASKSQSKAASTPRKQRRTKAEMVAASVKQMEQDINKESSATSASAT